jgi:hypothetical protein
LHLFSCACYPNLSTKAAHKLAPCSIRCVFLRYSHDHKGYRCLDLTNNNIVISQHVVFYEADFPFATSSYLTNDLDIFLQDDSSSVAPMPALLSVPHVSPGFSPLAAAGDQTACPGGKTAPRTKVGGPTVSPGSQTTPEIEAHGLTAHETEVGSPIATLGGQTAWPSTRTSSPASPTSAAPRMVPTTLVAPHTMPTTLVTPYTTPTTQIAPPAVPASQFYPQHYLRQSQAAREPPAPALHQQSPPVKAVPVVPPVNPHLMTIRAKLGFRLTVARLTLSATSALSLLLVPCSVHATLVDPN